MSLLSVAELAFRYPSTIELFHGATFSINPGDRLAVVGPNGAGKSTLLRILAGDLEPSAGAISRRRGLRVARLSQQPDDTPGLTLFDYVFDARPAPAVLRRRLAVLESRLGDAAVEYAEVVADYQATGGYAAEAEIERILDGLGFASLERALPLARLSGGQRTRAALARTLFADADLLLLDEPTNHLDLAAREWLEQQLANRRAACVLVSHDRFLLRRVATRVFEIERGRVAVFEGGYDDYRARRALLERQASTDYEAALRRKAAAEQAARRRSQLASRVAAPPAGIRSGHDFYRRKAAKVARTARILGERAAREQAIPKPWQEQPIPALDFGIVRRSGDTALVALGLSRAYPGKTLFAGLSFHLARGDRLAVTGPNGAGKSTLLRILHGLEPPDTGHVRIGANVQRAYFAQDAGHLPIDSNALDICGAGTLSRTLLGCLKLRPDRMTEPVRMLSAGERAKVALVRLLVSGANLLLLDEPTNHLEIEAQEALEQALVQFPGTVAVVSHDRGFLAGLGPALRTLSLPG
jgi:ATP-binding cassette subfamily F protein 3